LTFRDRVGGSVYFFRSERTGGKKTGWSKTALHAVR
jgi:hypothetical protein